MSYKVTTIPNFEKQFNRMEKKYPSIVNDITLLTETLAISPVQGRSLGSGLYKIRLSIKSKGQGKSGGARVITCVRVIESTVILCAIYDKSEKETLTPVELKKLLLLIP